MNASYLAFALAAIVPPETLADILNCTLSCDADERLNDQQVECLQEFHDALSDASPRAVDLAMGGTVR